MALIQKSVKLSEEDIEFAKSKGRNLSDGLRYCIGHTRDREWWMQEIRGMLKEPQESRELTLEVKSKILKIMED